MEGFKDKVRIRFNYLFTVKKCLALVGKIIRSESIRLTKRPGRGSKRPGKCHLVKDFRSGYIITAGIYPFSFFDYNHTIPSGLKPERLT